MHSDLGIELYDGGSDENTIWNSYFSAIVLIVGFLQKITKDILLLCEL